MENEVRLIDAYALAEDVEGLDITVAGNSARWTDAKHTVLRMIAQQSEIDPESLRPKGRWGVYRESEISKTVYCTNCWKEFYIHRKGELKIDTQPYCPNCGAKMEG